MSVVCLRLHVKGALRIYFLIPMLSALSPVPICMRQLVAACDVACNVGTLLKLKMCLFFLPLLLSFLLVSLRGCLKLPGLTLFTFSLFYRYQEETA